MWPFKKKEKVFCCDCKHSRLMSELSEEERRRCIETAYAACFNPLLVTKHIDSPTYYNRGTGEVVLTQYHSGAYYNCRNDCRFFEKK